ncbi:MAG: asparagine synthase-related protein, partial [Burkholderiaceae bacterium]|nr:asparagine synthase-related protein [Burkholderiaceae bacterium]
MHTRSVCIARIDRIFRQRIDMNIISRPGVQTAVNVTAPQAAPGPAFAGWFDPAGCPAGVSSHLCTDEQDAAVRVLQIGEALCIRFNPLRVVCDIDADGVLLLTGTARLGPGESPATPQALAQRLRQRGRDALSELRGRFLLVHADLRNGRLLAVTDRFAVYPFCFRIDGGRLYFSDRADCTQFAGELDTQALFDYVYFHVIPAPRTVYRNVLRLEPAHWLVFDRQGYDSGPWWEPRFAPDSSGSVASLKNNFCSLVEQAVARAADGAPVGCFLSGGTDSSTVAGMLTRLSGHPARTFSIGFDEPGYDEMQYARIAARHFGTEHHEYYVTPEDLLYGIPRVAAYYDQPFGNSSVLPAFYCALRAREVGVARLLAGDGGDELFGGNTRYAKQKVFALYEHLPKLLKHTLELLLIQRSWPQRLPVLRKAARYVAQARVPMPDRMETYNLLLRFGPSNVFTPRFLDSVDTRAPQTLQRRVYARTQARALIDRMLAYDWRFTLSDNDLPKVCGATRLADVDVAYPLLDDELVDFSLRLAPSLKVRGLTLRFFFKQALRDFLPPEIIRKRKHGFGLPFGPWLRRSAPLRQLAAHSLQQLAARGILLPALAGDLMSDRL